MKKIDPAVLSVSNGNPKTLITLKTKVVITKKSDYPVLEGFPRTTEILHLAKLERKSFDRQILRLQSLRILDLSENQLSSLPNELGTLPNLTELYLASNRLKFHFSKSSWMDGTSIRKNLKLLDISSNQVSYRFLQFFSTKNPAFFVSLIDLITKLGRTNNIMLSISWKSFSRYSFVENVKFFYARNAWRIFYRQ